MTTSLDFRTWAENIITRARQFGTAQDEIERSLKQAWEQGYIYAVKTDWWREREKCQHIHDYPPQDHCLKCGEPR